MRNGTKTREEERGGMEWRVRSDMERRKGQGRSAAQKNIEREVKKRKGKPEDISWN